MAFLKSDVEASYGFWGHGSTTQKHENTTVHVCGAIHFPIDCTGTCLHTPLCRLHLKAGRCTSYFTESLSLWHASLWRQATQWVICSIAWDATRDMLFGKFATCFDSYLLVVPLIKQQPWVVHEACRAKANNFLQANCLSHIPF